MNDEFIIDVEGEITDNDLQDIKDACAETSFNWKVNRVEFISKDFNVTQEAVITFWLLAPLGKYLTTLASEAAKDNYKSLKKFFGSLKKRNSAVLIRDSDTNIIYRVPSQLSDEEFVEAMKSLIETDLSKLDHGWVVYNKDKNSWRPHDEEWI